MDKHSAYLLLNIINLQYRTRLRIVEHLPSVDSEVLFCLMVGEDTYITSFSLDTVETFLMGFQAACR